MTDLEFDSIAEGLFKYILEQSQSPLDGIAILGLALLKVYASSTDGTIPISRFAEDFKRGLIKSYEARTSTGSTTRQ